MKSDAREPIAYVVDDDREICTALAALLRSVGIRVECFGSVSDFMECDKPDTPSCLILDVRLKGQSGLAAQEQIARQLGVPIIFITAHGDIEMSVQAMKRGAVDFIEKPFRDQRVLDAVASALSVDEGRRDKKRSAHSLHCHYASLTRRERDVMGWVAKGLMNKQIAAELGLSEITVKIYRAQAMRKMDARSMADFVLKAGALGLCSEGSSGRLPGAVEAFFTQLNVKRT
jgi:FixJ family two-component response regulator